ncbi:MAG: hypothetical protein HYU37_15625, partial [Acidobacteria bacterium]|nr:hypothetical protein [Acidobacteriota bacterium]
EMLTGRRAFDGPDVAAVLARVLEREPDWTLLPATTPSNIRLLLRRCLQKNVKKRLRDAADVRIEIEDALSAPPTPAPPATAIPARPLWQRTIPWVTGLLACLLTGLAVWSIKPAPAPRLVSRTAIALSQGERLAGLDQPAIALSPDGSQLVYVASDSGGTQRLYL